MIVFLNLLLNLVLMNVNRMNEFHEIHCSVNEIYNVKKELEKKFKNFISTDIEWIPIK